MRPSSSSSHNGRSCNLTINPVEVVSEGLYTCYTFEDGKLEYAYLNLHVIVPNATIELLDLPTESLLNMHSNPVCIHLGIGRPFGCTIRGSLTEDWQMSWLSGETTEEFGSIGLNHRLYGLVDVTSSLLFSRWPTNSSRINLTCLATRNGEQELKVDVQLELCSGQGDKEKSAAIQILPGSNETAVIGTDVTFTCEVFGKTLNYSVYIRWLFKGAVKSQCHFGRAERQGSSKLWFYEKHCDLTISPVVPSSQGQYVCHLYDGKEDVSESLDIYTIDMSEQNTDNWHNCDGNASYINTEDGFGCKCNDGFVGIGTMGNCRDINECDDSSTHTCDDNAVCKNTVGSFTCKCKAGYAGGGFTGSCQDINECDGTSTHNCDDNAVCRNTVGSFTCKCKAGYAGDGLAGSCQGDIIFAVNENNVRS
ncbi:fibrillin-2-like [Acanthaster planci]|uniref:Fibrillin-2-like n=1 Tax=Acanthaster planci TaxID=133434 RepID=A0A8B7XVF7_ACAPL|nr:fibrillin-2-like [Acanthaster planci]